MFVRPDFLSEFSTVLLVPTQPNEGFHWRTRPRGRFVAIGAVASVQQELLCSHKADFLRLLFAAACYGLAIRASLATLGSEGNERAPAVRERGSSRLAAAAGSAAGKSQACGECALARSLALSKLLVCCSLRLCSRWRAAASAAGASPRSVAGERAPFFPRRLLCQRHAACRGNVNSSHGGACGFNTAAAAAAPRQQQRRN